MNINLTTFYVVRHGETEWNVLQKIQGHTDISLNVNGKLQATKLAMELAHVKFDLALSSDLLRAKRTSEIIALERKLTIQTTEMLRERNFGRYEGLPNHTFSLTTYDALLKSMTIEQRRQHRLSEGVESDEELIARIITFLRETAVAHPGKSVLIGTHGGILRILLIHLGLATYQTLPLKSISNASYIKLKSDGVDFYVDEMKGIKINE